jgi:hypothetical protein
MVVDPVGCVSKDIDSVPTHALLVSIMGQGNESDVVDSFFVKDRLRQSIEAILALCAEYVVVVLLKLAVVADS